jgi:hypothetical protein
MLGSPSPGLPVEEVRMQSRRNLWTCLLIVAAAGCYDKLPGTQPEGAQQPLPGQAGPAKAAAEAKRRADAEPAADAPDAAQAPAADGGDDAGLNCEKGSSVAAHRVEFECGSITVYTCKDLSNVVVEFEDGSRQRFEGQSGHENSFSGTGSNAGKRIVGVWVKAGANHSGDGPGYGQRVDSDVSECPPPPGAGQGGGGSGGAGGCVAGPDAPCAPGPGAGSGGDEGAAGTGGPDAGDSQGPE